MKEDNRQKLIATIFTTMAIVVALLGVFWAFEVLNFMESLR